MDRHKTYNSERGVATVEFAMTAAFFFMMLVVVVAAGNLFWTHNALVEATRRGARYAANQCKPSVTLCTNATAADDRIKKMVVYGKPDPADTDNPLITNLQLSNISVARSDNFGVAAGTVTVSICQSTGGGCVPYQYDFSVPGFSSLIQMPACSATLIGENAGFVPADK